MFETGLDSKKIKNKQKKKLKVKIDKFERKENKTKQFKSSGK